MPCFENLQFALKCMTAGERCGVWLQGERATNDAETYLILKLFHLFTDQKVSVRALEIINENFLSLLLFCFDGDKVLLLN